MTSSPTSVPWWTGPLLGFDLETTGTNPFDARPVSFAFVQYELGVKTSSFSHLVNPGVPIPSEATAVHRITDHMVEVDGLPLEHALETIVEMLLDMDERDVPIVGMNISFDLTIVDNLARRRDARGLRERGWNGAVIDVGVLDRHLDKWRKGKRTLTDLCHTYGLALANAHDAEADTAASVEVLLAIVHAYPNLELVSPRRLTLDEMEWRREWHDELNEYRERLGQTSIPISEGEWPIMRSKP